MTKVQEKYFLLAAGVFFLLLIFWALKPKKVSAASGSTQTAVHIPDIGESTTFPSDPYILN